MTLAIAALCSIWRNGAAKGLDYSASLDQKWLAMAFGMPEANLSSRTTARNAAKNSQLDILAFGMPKTFR
ncbi:hypothetical protein JQ612_05060 [Bradyrhizobium manausense]|uniref:hypothetical protein n=1 Tax=Bradyrhizobium manausense TaxID=989370 RepID=UPI001BA96080|nr:hypothetical protein [Bradyrhizobium manausense]MBR0832556.1 hypothetical protein [Bradyrhizobium manausense]